MEVNRFCSCLFLWPGRKALLPSFSCSLSCENSVSILIPYLLRSQTSVEAGNTNTESKKGCRLCRLYCLQIVLVLSMGLSVRKTWVQCPPPPHASWAMLGQMTWLTSSLVFPSLGWIQYRRSQTSVCRRITWRIQVCAQDNYWVSDSQKLGWGPGICISNELSRAANCGGLGSHGNL